MDDNTRHVQPGCLGYRCLCWVLENRCRGGTELQLKKAAASLFVANGLVEICSSIQTKEWLQLLPDVHVHAAPDSLVAFLSAVLDCICVTFGLFSFLCSPQRLPQWIRSLHLTSSSPHTNSLPVLFYCSHKSLAWPPQSLPKRTSTFRLCDLQLCSSVSPSLNRTWPPPSSTPVIPVDSVYASGRETDLGGPEAEGGGRGVRLLPVLQDQSSVLAQSQVATGGEVTQPEGLTPANVAAAPAVHKNRGVTSCRCGRC